MEKNILLINGATRKNGNTDIIVKKIVEGAESNNIQLNAIELKKLKMSDCTGCYNCFKEVRCPYDDDMQPIYKDVEKSELIILVSPMYWWFVTGLMKMFLDRLYLYYPRRNTGILSEKKAIIITPMFVSNVEKESGILVEFYRLILKRLGITIANKFFFSGLSEKNDVLNHPEYLDTAFKLGQNLHSYLEK
ncbi:flavodoxin family protein [candidate division KSB1 bacterium]